MHKLWKSSCTGLKLPTGLSNVNELITYRKCLVVCNVLNLKGLIITIIKTTSE